MSEPCSTKKRSKRNHAEQTDQIMDTLIQQSESRKSKKKRRREGRTDEESIKNDNYHNVILPNVSKKSKKKRQNEARADKECIENDNSHDISLSNASKKSKKKRRKEATANEECQENYQDVSLPHDSDKSKKKHRDAGCNDNENNQEVNLSDDRQKFKKKRRKEAGDAARCTGSENYQDVKLPDHNTQSGDNEDGDILLIRHDRNETEMKEVADVHQSELFENEQEDSELDESGDDTGNSSESELETQSEDDIVSMKHNTGNLTKKILHSKLTRDIDMENLETDIEKLEELEIVIDWTPSPLHLSQSSLSHISQGGKKYLMEEGIMVKKGAWTLEEDRILSKNWTDFSKEYDMRNPLCLLGLQQGIHIAKHKGVAFAKYLGRGLDDRPLLSIYQRARRLLDPRNFKGRFSKNEWKTLQRLVIKHGNKWTKLSHQMDRSADSLYDYYKVHAKETSHGAWTIKEDQRLISAVSKFTGEKDLNKIHHDLPWSEFAKLVKTRNESQCRSRWIYIVSWIVCGKLKERIWKIEDSIQFIKLFRDCAYQTASDIPWDTIYKEFRCMNCFQLKLKWSNLRLRVPQYYIKTHTEIVDWLADNHLPILEQKLKKRKLKEKDATKDKSVQLDETKQ